MDKGRESVLETVRKISDRLLQLFHDNVDIYGSVERVSDLLDEIHDGVEVLIAELEEDLIVMSFAKVDIPIAKNITIPLSKKCMLCYIVDSGEEIYLKNLWDFSRDGYKLTALRKPSYGEKLSFLGVPIKSSRKTIGVVGFITDGYDSMSEDEKDAFRTVAKILGFFMKRTSQRDLDIDRLTGSMSRDKFLSIMRDLKGYSSVLVVRIRDLDRIRLVLGYKKRDEVLRAVAFSMKRRLQKEEMIVRLGENVFSAVLKREINPEEFVEDISGDVTRRTGIPVDLEYGYSEVKTSVEAAVDSASSNMRRYGWKSEKSSGYTVITDEDLKKFEDSDKGVAIHTIDRILYANKKILDMIGVEKLEDLESYTALSFTTSEYKEMAYRRAKLVLDTAAKLPPAIEKGFMSDGRTLTVVVNTFPVIFKGEKAVMIFIEDISSYMIKESAENFLKIISSLLSSLLPTGRNLCKNLLSLAKNILPDMNIAVFEVKDDEYRMICGRVLSREYKDLVFSPKEVPVVEKYVLEGKDILIPDVSKIVENCKCPFGLEKEEVSHYGYPIEVDGKVKFVLVASKMGYNSIKPYEIDLLKVVVNHLERNLNVEALKKEIERFKEKAFKDPLTGAYTRAFFEEWLKSYEEKLKRFDEVSSVVLMDIDCLKAFNDTYGHEFGDRILREFSRGVMRSIRDMDILVRWGGDEFILLLQGVGLEMAREIMRRVKSSVQVPFSYGMSFMNREKSFEEAFRESDSALYSRKREKEECEEILKKFQKLAGGRI